MPAQVRYVINGRGQVISIYDKAWGRELVPEGAAGNRFRYAAAAHELWEKLLPARWDAHECREPRERCSSRRVP